MMQLIVKNMDIKLELNGITCMIGPSNSGKTTFLKKLINKINNEDIFIDDVNIKEYDVDFLRRNIAVCLDDNYFAKDHVAEELSINLSKLGYKTDEIVKKIEAISKYFRIDNLLNERIDSLKYEDKVLIKILSFLIISPKIFGIDNLVCYLSRIMQDRLYDYVRENDICLVNVVTEADYILDSDYVIVMNNYKALMCVDSLSVLNGNSILPYLGIKLPFVVDLSNNLIAYGIVNKIETVNRELVNKIWK